jgi:hypothetical protein
MAQWAVMIPGERFDDERLYQRESIELPTVASAEPGDEVLLVADLDGPAVVALGRVVRSSPLVVRYARRLFDEPCPAPQLALDGPVTRLEPAAYRTLSGGLAPAPDPRAWLVSVALPIEAATPAEAVRLFWTYVSELGPRELPAYVSPTSDELAMQAYVLGGEASQDPEDD